MRGSDEKFLNVGDMSNVPLSSVSAEGESREHSGQAILDATSKIIIISSIQVCE